MRSASLFCALLSLMILIYYSQTVAVWVNSFNVVDISKGEPSSNSYWFVSTCTRRTGITECLFLPSYEIYGTISYSNCFFSYILRTSSFPINHLDASRCYSSCVQYAVFLVASTKFVLFSIWSCCATTAILSNRNKEKLLRLTGIYFKKEIFSSWISSWR